MKRQLVLPGMAREWAPFGKALKDTKLHAFAWIVDPKTMDFCSAASDGMTFRDVVQHMAFLLAAAGKDKRERENIRTAFLKQFDRYLSEMDCRK